MTEGLNFGLFGTTNKVQSSDYKSADSNQGEILDYAKTETAATWLALRTVTAGKTFYVSSLIISCSAAGSQVVQVGTGDPGSETPVFSGFTDATTPLIMNFPVPIKFTTGTKISVKNETSTTHTYFNFIGWEE